MVARFDVVVVMSWSNNSKLGSLVRPQKLRKFLLRRCVSVSNLRLSVFDVAVVEKA